MKMTNYLPLKRGSLIVAAICLAQPAQADLLYVLQPGSTITPYHNGSPSGPSEALTGTFTWRLYTIGLGQAVYDATSLSFQSASFVLTLDTTSVNNVATSLFLDTHVSYFEEVVEGSGGGLPSIPFAVSTVGGGSFVGSLENPTRLAYPSLLLQAYDASSPYVAILSFEAVQVPEPGVQVLLLTGFTLLVGRRLRLGVAEQGGFRQRRDSGSVPWRAPWPRRA